MDRVGHADHRHAAEEHPEDADRSGPSTGQHVPQPEQHHQSLRPIDGDVGVEVLAGGPGSGDGKVPAFVGAERCGEKPCPESDRDQGGAGYH